jgi:hypothetical protein
MKKTLAAAIVVLVLAAVTGASITGCADHMRPVTTAENQAAPAPPSAPLFAKDGGGGW